MKSKRSIIFIALLLLVIFVTSAFSYARYVNSQTINGTITTVERVYDVNYSIYFYKDDTLQEDDTENYTIHCDVSSNDYCYDSGVEVNYTVDNGKYDGYYYNDNDCYLYSFCDYSDFLSDGGTINLYYDPLPYYEVQYYIDGVLQSGDTETSYGIPGDDYIYPSFNTSKYEGYDFMYAEIEGSTYFPGDDLPSISNGATIYVYYEETLAYCGFRGTPSAGDTVVHGDYIYTYMLTPLIDVEGYMNSGDTSTSNLLNYISMEGMSSGWSVRVNDTSKSSPITSQICSTITDDENEEPITSTNLMYFMSASSSVDVSTLNSSNVTQSQAMFAFNNISNITGLNLMNTTNITDMSGMFSGNQITSLNLTNFDTSNVTNMAVMFYGSQLTSINVSSFNTSNVQNMTVMFGNLQYLQSLDLSNFNTSNVYSMYGMFSNCSSLSSLNISSFNASHVLSMNSMFYDCSNLTTLDLSGFNTQSLVDISYIFYNCSSIISLDLGSFDLSNINDYEYAFDGMTSLNLIRTPSVNPSSGSIIQLPNIFTDGQLLYMNIGQQLLGDDSMDMIEFYISPTNTVLQRTTVSILKTGNNVNTILKTLAGNDTNESDIDENIKYIVKSNTSPSSSNMTDDNIISLGGDDMLMPTYAWVNGNVLYYYTNAQILVANPNSSNLFKGFESLEYLDLSGMNFSLILMQNNFFDGDNSLETIITPSVNPAYAYNDVIIPLPATFKDDEDNCYVFIGHNTSQMDYGSPTSTELNRSTASMLKTGQEIQELFNEIGKSNVYNITHYSGVPDQTILSQSAIISIDSSDDTFGYFADLLVPTYAWYDMNSGTLYYYSEAESIFLHPNSAQLFSLLTSLQSIDFDFKGDFLVSASAMFSANTSLTSLDLSNFKAPKIQYMGHMFDSCGYIEELDLSGFDLSNIQEEGEIPAYEYAFNSMNSLDTIITPSKNPSNGINIELPAAFKDSNGNVYMYLGSNMGFYNTPNNIEITKTTVSILDTGNSVNDKLKSIIGNAVFDGDFYVDESIKYIVKSNNPPSSNIINDNYNIATSEIPVYPTYAWADNDTLYYYSPAEYIFMNPNSEILFAAFNSLETIDLQFRTDLVTRMGGMFLGDSSLETLNLSSFNTSNTTNMRYMFQECNNLISLNLSSFNTSKVTDMSGMFYGIGVHTLNLSNFDTSKVNNFEYMFNGCTELETLDLSEFDTSSVTDMYGMFYKCGNLVSLDISNFDTTNVTDMSSMFYGCQSIKKLDLSSFNLTNLSDSSSIFDGTSELREIVTPASMGSVPLVLYDTMYDIDDNDYTQIDSTTPTNISIYVRFIAEFDTGQNVNAILKELAGNNGATYETVDTNVTKIVRTNIEPDNHYELINSDDSEYKIKAFYEDGIIYYWTDATIINLNSDASNMFSDFSNLELVDVSTTRAENSQNIMNMFSNSPVKTLYARNRATVELIQYYSSVVDTNSDTAVMTKNRECYTDFVFGYGDSTSIGQYTYTYGYEPLIDLNEYFSTNNISFYTSDINGLSVKVKDPTSFSPLVGGVCKYINDEPVTSMSLMYTGSYSSTIDVSEMDTSLVTNMYGMFGMSGATTLIGLDTLNTSNVADMTGMFAQSLLSSLDLSNFDTRNVTSMMAMFAMSGITNLNLSTFDTSKLENISFMFNTMPYLAMLDMSGLDLSNISEDTKVFYENDSLQYIRTPKANPGGSVPIELPGVYSDADKVYMYIGNNNNYYSSPTNAVLQIASVSILKDGYEVNNILKSLAGNDISNADPIVQDNTIRHIVYSSSAPDPNDITDDNVISRDNFMGLELLPTYAWVDNDTLYYYSEANYIYAYADARSLFAGFANLEDIDLNIKTDLSSYIDYMFAEDPHLTYLDLSGFDFEHVESANNVFHGDYYILEIVTPKVNPPLSVSIQLNGLFRDNNDKIYYYIGNNEGLYSSPTNESLYITTFSTLDTGENVNNKLKALAGNTIGDELVTDTTIRHIVYSSVAPDPNDMTSDNIISVDDYYSPTYAWVDGNTLYYYSASNYIILNEDSYGLFAGFLAVEDIDINFRTELVTDMRGMFAYDMSLESIDLSGFVTVLTQDMSGMFYNCSSLDEIDLTSFSTKNLRNTDSMFEGMTARVGYAYTNLDAKKFNDSLNKPIRLKFNYEVEVSEEEKVAYLDTGENVNKKIKRLAGNYIEDNQYAYWVNDNNITSIELSPVEPNPSNMLSDNKISLNSSNFPVYAWYEDGTIYYYTEATKIYLNTDSTALFSSLHNLENIDLSIFDSSNVESMSIMFYLCESITSLDLSGFETPNLISMFGMFLNCNSLTGLDISNFDLSHMPSMTMFNDSQIPSTYYTFEGTSLERIKTPKNFGSHTISLNDLFEDENGNFVTSLTSGVVTGEWIQLALNIAKLDTGYNVRNKIINIAGNINEIYNFMRSTTAPNINEMTEDNIISVGNIPVYIWLQPNSNIIRYYSSEETIYMNPNSSSMFNNFYNLTNLNISNFDSSLVYNMSSMFNDCRSLRILNLTNFDTSNVTYMSSMFSGCINLQEIDMSSFYLENLDDSWDVFYGCYSLIKIKTPIHTDYTFELPYTYYDLNSNEYTSIDSETSTGAWIFTDIKPTLDEGSNVNNIIRNYIGGNIYHLTSISYYSNLPEMSSLYSNVFLISPENSYPVYAWYNNETLYYYSDYAYSPATVYLNSNSGSLFSGFTKVASIDLSYLNTSEVIDMSYMFQNCSSLVSIDLSGFNTSNVTSVIAMFENCSSLTSLDLSSFNMSNLYGSEPEPTNDMLYGMSSLEELYTPHVYSNYNIVLPKLMVDGNNNSYTTLTNSSPTQTRLETKNEAILCNGQYVNSKFKKLSGQSNANNYTKNSLITSIQRSSEEPSLSYMTPNNNISYGSIPIYAWYENNILYIYTTSQTIYLNEDSSYLFYNLNNLSSLLVSGLNLSNVKYMSYMFANTSFTDLNLYGLDLSNVYVSNMLDGIDELQTFTTPSVYGGTLALPKTMVDSNNNSYNSLTIGSPTNTTLQAQNIARLKPGEKVNQILKRLSGQSNATYDTSNTTITNIVRSNNAPSASNMTNEHIISSDRIPVYAWYDNGTIYYYSESQTIYLNQNSSNIFYNFRGLISIDLSGFDTPYVTNMNNAFGYCYALTSLDLSSIRINIASNMFNGDNSLRQLITPNSISSGTSIYLPRILYDTNNNAYASLTSSTPTSTLLQTENIARLDTGQSLNVKFKKLSGQTSATYTTTNSTITSIVRSSTAPSSSNMTEEHIISVDRIPVYAWYDSGVIYYYSESQTIFLNQSSANLFYNFTGLQSIDLSNCDMSKVNLASNMFYNLSSFRQLITPSYMNSGLTISLSQTLYDTNNNAYTALTSSTPTSTLLEKKIESFLDTGRNINVKLKKLSGQSTAVYYDMNATITSIVRSNTAPSAGNMTSDNTISLSSSSYPTYAWYVNGTIYYYSEANILKLNSNSSHMFYGMQSLMNIELSSFDTSSVTSINYMFCYCNSLVSLDLSSFNLSNIGAGNNTSGMLSNLTSLKQLITPRNIRAIISIDLPRILFDTNNNSYTSLTSSTPTSTLLQIENIARLDTGEIVNAKFKALSGQTSAEYYIENTTITSIVRSNTAPSASNMTEEHIISVDRIPVYAWYDSGVIYYYSEAQTIYLNQLSSYLFYYFDELQTIDLSSFDTSRVNSMNDMFGYNSNLVSLDLSDFNTSNVTDMSDMFNSCISLTVLDLSSFDTHNVYYINGMFSKCNNLETIYVSELWDLSNVIRYETYTEPSSDPEEPDYEYEEYIEISLFYDCTSLIGGNGTTWDSGTMETDDIDYARVDKQVYDPNTGTWSEDTTKPGLLTLKSSGSLGYNGLSNSLNAIASSDSLFNGFKSIIKSVLVKIRVLKKYLIIVNPLIRD